MKIVSTKSTDGISYKGLLTEPNSRKGIGIHIHGMAGSVILNSYYQPMHELYSQNGWAFLVGENRGTGTATQFSSEDGVVTIGNAYEIFEECVHDIQGWVDLAKSLGYEKIWLQAHSLGTCKAAYYFSTLSDSDIDGLILLSPVDMIGLVYDEFGTKDHEILLNEAQSLEKRKNPRQLLSKFLWDEYSISAQTYLSLFGKGAKDAIFNYSKPELGWEVVNSLEIPVLAITGTKDTGIVSVIDPYKAMDLLESQLLNSPRKKTIVYNGADHGFKGFEQSIVEDVLKFVEVRQ